MSPIRPYASPRFDSAFNPFGALEAYPKSDEFKDMEELLRELLDGPPHTWCTTK